MTKANTLINQIANLNTAIADDSSTGFQPNALIDQRYQALSQLSSLIPVNYSEDSNGIVTVTTTDAGGPLTIVSGGTATPISTASTITGGQFGGLTDSLTDLQGYITRLNDFASTLINQVNTIQTDNGCPAVFTGTDASTITASTTFLNGQSSATETTVASQMSSLQDSTITFLDGKQGTFSDYLSDIMNQVGTDSEAAQTNQTFNTSLQSQLQTQQQTVSGVSLDEETVNLIQFQQVYQAAAKVVDVTAQMLSSLMAAVGTTG